MQFGAVPLGVMHRRGFDPVEEDPTLQRAARLGYTPDNLPALRQYLKCLEAGNLEATERIGKNLDEFFAKIPEV